MRGLKRGSWVEGVTEDRAGGGEEVEGQESGNWAGLMDTRGHWPHHRSHRCSCHPFPAILTWRLCRSENKPYRGCAVLPPGDRAASLQAT